MTNKLLLIEAWLRARSTHEKGQGLAEYGLILGLIAVVAVIALTGLGAAVAGLFSNLAAPL